MRTPKSESVDAATIAESQVRGGIDLKTEDLVSLGEAARLVARWRGTPCAASTIWRWSTQGMGGARLETIKVGRTTCTSIERLQRFFDELSRSERRTGPTTSPAAKLLDDYGI